MITLFLRFLCSIAPLALTLLLGAGGVRAADLVTERAYWKDDTAQASYAQAISQNYKPLNGVLSGGYTQAAHWMRLHVMPPVSIQEASGKVPTHWVVRIRPTYLDRIELYDPAAPIDAATGVPVPRTTGDRSSWLASDYQSLNHGFLIPTSPEPRDIYLRLTSTSTHLMYVEVLTTAEAAHRDRQQDLMYSAGIGVLVLFGGWALVHWLIRRERLLGIFLVRQTLVTLHAMVFLGYFRVLLAGGVAPALLDRLTSLVILVVVPVAFVFELMLHREFKPRPWLWWGTASMLLFSVASLGLFFMGYDMPALRLNMLLIFLGPLLMFAMALTNQAWKPAATGALAQAAQPVPLLSQRAFILYYVGFLASNSISSVPALGWVQTVEWVINAPLFSAFFTGALMVAMLQARSRNQDLLGQNALIQLQVAERQTLIERERHDEQTRFLAMLTHELKTPLSVVRMVLGAPHASAALVAEANHAIADMSDVIERCVQAGKLADHKLEVRPQTLELPAALLAWCAGGAYTGRIQLQANTATLAPMQVQADVQLLRIVVSNLFDNAAKYSPADSKIDVALQAHEQQGQAGVQLTVRNLPGSAGWPDAKRVFDKYYRSPGAHQETGSGLGLYLVQGIAHMLGGQVRYAPTQTHIAFTVWIPA